jgi:hypothetical protein
LAEVGKFVRSGFSHALSFVPIFLSASVAASPHHKHVHAPLSGPTNPKATSYAERRFSSGGESDYESDSSGKLHRKTASAECFDLHSIRASVRADGNLNGNVVRMETPFGKTN